MFRCAAEVIRGYERRGMSTLKSGTSVTSFALDKIEPAFTRAEVRFDGLTPPQDSFEVRIFLGEPNASAKTPVTGNPHYIGSHYFYGLGAAAAANAPEDRRRGTGQFAPAQIRVNVTEELRAYVARSADANVPVTLVAVDQSGREIAEPSLSFESLSLVTS